jgi:hypothetical protein
MDSGVIAVDEESGVYNEFTPKNKRQKNSANGFG